MSSLTYCSGYKHKQTSKHATVSRNNNLRSAKWHHNSHQEKIPTLQRHSSGKGSIVGKLTSYGLPQTSRLVAVFGGESMKMGMSFLMVLMKVSNPKVLLFPTSAVIPWKAYRNRRRRYGNRSSNRMSHYPLQWYVSTMNVGTSLTGGIHQQ